MTGSSLPEMGQHRPRHPQQAKNIRFIDFVNFILTRFLNCADEAVARVVDKHVNASELDDHAEDGIRNLSRILQIHRNRKETLRSFWKSVGDLLWIA